MAVGAARASKVSAEGHEAAGTSVRVADAAGIWDKLRRRLRAELGEDVFNSWFARVDLESCAAGVVRLSVPTIFLKGWIKSHYGDRILELWRIDDDSVGRVDVVRRSAMRLPVAEDEAPRREERRHIPVQAETVTDRFAGSPLDPRLTFASFCEGRSNDVAYRAAHAVATAPEGSVPLYNPLYLHAGVGLGKTHLLQAIAQEARHGQRGGRRALYLTVERFTIQFVGALRDRSALEFKERLRSIDIMLIDDMQFLTGPKVQQEFCHMLNALLDSGKQVVVAADRPPAELEGVDERVISRLKGGVVVGLAAPDVAMRRQILQTRLAAARERNPALAIPDPVIDYVAQVIATNGRDLDGALNRLICTAEFSAAVTMENAEAAIADLVGTREPRRIRIEDIQKVVATHYNVSKHDLLSARRTRTIVRPRQIAMYLAKTMTPRSFPEIGKRFGGRDHTTVLHAVRKVEELRAADDTLSQEIELLKRMIQD